MAKSLNMKVVVYKLFFL